MIFSLLGSAFAPQSAGGEWSGTCKEDAQPVSPPTLLSHLIMWNNFSRCPALISLCGNSSLVPNCGARRTQAEHTAERKGNNWSLPCLAHRFLLTFIIIMSFTEGDCMISFRHFMSAAPLFEPLHYLAQSLYLLLSFLYCQRFATWFLSSYTNGIKCVVGAKRKKTAPPSKDLDLIFILAWQRCRWFTRWFQNVTATPCTPQPTVVGIQKWLWFFFSLPSGSLWHHSTVTEFRCVKECSTWQGVSQN